MKNSAACSVEPDTLSGNGWLAYIGTTASIIACYIKAIAVFALPILGADWEMNPHLQAVFMWALALLAVIAIFRDRKRHGDHRPFLIAASGLLIIVATLYSYYHVLILFLGYLLLLLGTFLNQNAILKKINLHNRQQATELAELNQTLETRVKDQVAELEKIGQLKRFLAPEVADLVIEKGDNSLLQSHRAYVAALFCDLRGFTPFSEGAEPEDVMNVLQQYHLVVGRLVAKCSGTVNHRAGDGLMIIFNDPMPCDEPVFRAVKFAIDARESVGELANDWARHGHDLGFGIGISAGYVTLGIIGDDQRSDYTAIGNAINLASRLSGKAKNGQILLSERAYLEIEDKILGQEISDLKLDGISQPQKFYSFDTLL